MSDIDPAYHRTLGDDYREFAAACLLCESAPTSAVFLANVHVSHQQFPYLRSMEAWLRFLDTEIRLRRLADGLPS